MQYKQDLRQVNRPGRRQDCASCAAMRISLHPTGHWQGPLRSYAYWRSRSCRDWSSLRTWLKTASCLTSSFLTVGGLSIPDRWWQVSWCSYPLGMTDESRKKMCRALFLSLYWNSAYCLVDEKPLLQRFLVTAGVEAVHQQQNTWELIREIKIMSEKVHPLYEKEQVAKVCCVPSHVQNKETSISGIPIAS